MNAIDIRPAQVADCRAVAELAQMAGDDIPGYFWAQEQHPGESLIDSGARKLAAGLGNFSYRNTTLALRQDAIAGMLLGYRLPSAADNDEDPADFPAWVRPLIELEQRVPDSFYINMLACFEPMRGLGIGSVLLAEVDRLARAAGCSVASIEVFSTNVGALRLYQRLGYSELARLPMVGSPAHPDCDVVLLTRRI